MTELLRDKIYAPYGDGTLTFKTRRGKIVYIKIFWKKEQEHVTLEFVDITANRKGTKTETIPLGIEISGNIVVKSKNTQANTYHEIWIDILMEDL